MIEMGEIKEAEANGFSLVMALLATWLVIALIIFEYAFDDDVPVWKDMPLLVWGAFLAMLATVVSFVVAGKALGIVLGRSLLVLMLVGCLIGVIVYLIGLCARQICAIYGSTGLALEIQGVIIAVAEMLPSWVKSVGGVMVIIILIMMLISVAYSFFNAVSERDCNSLMAGFSIMVIVFLGGVVLSSEDGPYYAGGTGLAQLLVLLGIGGTIAGYISNINRNNRNELLTMLIAGFVVIGVVVGCESYKGTKTFAEGTGVLPFKEVEPAKSAADLYNR